MSTPTHKDYIKININRHSEIVWLKENIETLVPKLSRKPSTIKQIHDLQRQIQERGGTLEVKY